MSELLTLSSKAGLNLVAVECAVGSPIPVPSFMHWKQGHFSAIVERRGSWFRVSDPLIQSNWIQEKTIRAASSACFLVISNGVLASLPMLQTFQLDSVKGRLPCGYPCPWEEFDNGADCLGSDSSDDNSGAVSYASAFGCTLCGGGGGAGHFQQCPQCGSGGGPSGIPVWNVSEPYINLWLFDEPLGYRPGVGRRISFALAYKQREQEAGTLGNVSCGLHWNCSWVNYINASSPYSQNQPEMKTPTGRDEIFTADGATAEYYSSAITVSNVVSGALIGYSVTYPDGSMDLYNYPATDGSGDTLFYRTASLDPGGHSTLFNYSSASGSVLLSYVVDADGRANTLEYTNSPNPTLITGVTDPFNRKIILKYDASTSMLTNITDVVGLSSGFIYDDNEVVTNLITPYGVTTFNYSLPTEFAGRSMMVVDPMSQTNLYIFANAVTFLAPSYTAPTIPDSAPALCSVGTDMANLNSWHWGPLQFAQLSTSNPSSFLTTDYLKARQRHWFMASTNIGAGADALGMEQAPSPDGITTGQQIWFSYDGCSCPNAGTTTQRAVSATILPDGNSWYQWIRRGFRGHPTNVVDIYSSAFQTTPLLRTNVFYYQTNGIDMMQHVGPLGETVLGCYYDTHHNLLMLTNAVGDVITNTYDAQSRLTSTTTATGLTTTNIFFASGSYTNWVQSNIDLQIGRVNTWSYVNDLVSVHTNELNSVITNTYDYLQRLTSVSYSDGTHNSNIYTKLDLVEMVDRLAACRT
jgi:YD repeat-containing protein